MNNHKHHFTNFKYLVYFAMRVIVIVIVIVMLDCRVPQFNPGNPSRTQPPPPDVPLHHHLNQHAVSLTRHPHRPTHSHSPYNTIHSLQPPLQTHNTINYKYPPIPPSRHRNPTEPPLLKNPLTQSRAVSNPRRVRLTGTYMHTYSYCTQVHHG